MKKNDFKAALVLGALVGLLVQPVVDNIYRGSKVLAFLFGTGGLNPSARAGILVFFSLFAPFALWVMYLLGKVWPVLYQFGKFAAVGTLNSFISFGVLNIQSLLTGITSGIWIPVFATVAFLAATTNSFFWNKYWTFGTHGGPRTGETVKFYIIAGAGWALNVATVSVVVNYLHPQNVSPEVWLNAGALAGVAASFLWDFFGYKYLVFKETEEVKVGS
jgi:putative flippase GtrA